jgi:hypothetical protein
MAKINWNKARTMYVADDTVSYLQVAETFGVSHKAVKDRGAKEGWREQRSKLSIRVNDRLVDQAADQLSEVNERHTNMYKNMQALGLAELNIALINIRKAQEKASLEGRDVSFDDKSVMGQQRLKFLFDGLKIAMDGERITLGLPTAVSVSKNEITGKDGDALFEQVNLDDISARLTRAVAALGPGDTEEDSA